MALFRDWTVRVPRVFVDSTRQLDRQFVRPLLLLALLFVVPIPFLELLWAQQAVFGHGFPPPSPGTNGVTFSAVALKPESRGHITLKSNRIWDTPLIDPKSVKLPWLLLSR